MFFIKRKYKIIITAFLAAGLIAGGVYLRQSYKNLAAYRLAAGYSSGAALEETIAAVEGLSGALDKSVYAMGRGMSARVCAGIYARALAAETAISTLPFATAELEQISAFLNMSGDYAYALSYSAAEQGFSREQREILGSMAGTASELGDCLRGIRAALQDGSIIMDSRELSLINVFGENEAQKLSTRLLQYESEFRPLEELVYDGQYGRKQEKSSAGDLTGEEMRALAAEYLGTEPELLRDEYEYEGQEGRCCYSWGDMLICVSPGGVESFSGSRLVGEIKISREQAERAAEDYLKKRGFKELELLESSLEGALLSLRYAKTEDGALCQDNCLRISVAMDDGAVYAFDSCSYNAGETEAEWKLDENEASAAIPESLRPAGSRRVIRQSPGGRDLACWEFSCVNEKGSGVRIYVDAETGEQFDIVTEQGSSR